MCFKVVDVQSCNLISRITPHRVAPAASWCFDQTKVQNTVSVQEKAMEFSNQSLSQLQQKLRARLSSSPALNLCAAPLLALIVISLISLTLLAT